MPNAETPTAVPLTNSKGMTLAHGSAVALGSRAVLIIGPSASGKSGLALELMGLGAMLIGDDRVAVTHVADGLIAAPPPNIAGRVEARGVGILAADVARPTQIVLVVDMGQVECTRLPPPRRAQVADVALPLFHKVESRHFAAAILQYLKSGSVE